MARKKRGGDGGGVPDWLVTFGDLMSLLVTFFVLIISYSVQDDEKVQVVAGSIKDAFGIEDETQRVGIIEIMGMPTRKYSAIQDVDTTLDEGSLGRFESQAAGKTRAEAAGRKAQEEGMAQAAQSVMQAAATLRQAWKSLPDLAEVSDNILVEETPEGANVQLVDQEGKPMFAKGSPYPFEHTREALIALVPTLSQLPNRIVITGHTARESDPRGEYTNWELSSDRANAVRRVLVDGGLDLDRILAIQGKADVQPLFPNNPGLPVNARVTIQLITEMPPVPPGLKP